MVNEIKPAVGTGNALSQAEIRYCLSERIRIETMEAVVNTQFSGQVSRFNASVDDYNSRCANYRYRRSDMDAARSAVEANRASIESAARALVWSWR
ncbi:hypothetical protein [Salinarimonas soli]|uniref:Uncharacterized protein n=1 Tax=Salinarimonas soli TaxID=1638099 RepID=A0A5B2VAX7_9HYPH|nr:hypothetical protein [Salinarimonas soli]KAA2235878.1 hypothetical protein F0L46_17720 [Salinarimonas soli]